MQFLSKVNIVTSEPFNLLYKDICDTEGFYQVKNYEGLHILVVGESMIYIEDGRFEDLSRTSWKLKKFRKIDVSSVTITVE